MKRLLFMLSFVLAQPLLAQEQEQPVNLKPIDSLLDLVSSTKDESLQAIYYSQIANKYYLGEDLENAELYAKKGLQIAEKLNDRKAIGSYHIQLAEMNVVKRKYNEAIQDAKIASEELRKTNDMGRFLTAEYLIAYVYGTMDKVKEAISRMEKALEISKNSPCYLDKGKLYYELSIDYSSENNPSKALYNLQKALENFNKAKFTPGVYGCYWNMVELYMETKDWKQAKKYCLLDLANPIAPVYATQLKYSASLTRMSEIEMKLGNYPSALLYAKKALKRNQKYKVDICQPTSLKALAQVYIALNEPKKANEALKSAIKYKDYIDKPLEIELYNLLRKSYQQINDVKNAGLYLDKTASAQADYEKEKGSTGVSLNNIEIYKDLAQASQSAGDYKEAYEYYEKYATLYRQRTQDEKDKKVTELQAKFQLTHKDIELKDLTIEKQKSSLQMASQKNTLLLTIGGLIIAMLLIVFVSWKYRVNKKNNRVLALKNEDLEVSQTALRQSMGEKDLLLKEIHHRVKNNLQLVISLLNIQARENNTAEVEDFLEKGRGRIVSMALIHQNLYQADNLAKVDFQEYLENLASASLGSFDDDLKVTFSIEAQDVYFDIQTSIPLGLIINELICNSMKHAFDAGNEGIIKITILQNAGGNFSLAFSDNGKGMGNANVYRESFGTELVKLLSMQLGGELSITGDNGTTYHLTFEDHIAA